MYEYNSHAALAEWAETTMVGSGLRETERDDILVKMLDWIINDGCLRGDCSKRLKALRPDDWFVVFQDLYL